MSLNLNCREDKLRRSVPVVGWLLGGLIGCRREKLHRMASRGAACTRGNWICKVKMISNKPLELASDHGIGSSPWWSLGLHKPWLKKPKRMPHEAAVCREVPVFGLVLFGRLTKTHYPVCRRGGVACTCPGSCVFSPCQPGRTSAGRFQGSRNGSLPTLPRAALGHSDTPQNPVRKAMRCNSNLGQPLAPARGFTSGDSREG